MADANRAVRDALERTQTEVKQLRLRLEDPSDAERTAAQLRDEQVRLETRAGQLTRELPELREAAEAARLEALDAKRLQSESSRSYRAEARLLGTLAAVGAGIWLGLAFGSGLWDGIRWAWLPWAFGLPAGVMLVRELYELGQKLGAPYRDEPPPRSG